MIALIAASDATVIDWMSDDVRPDEGDAVRIVEPFEATLARHGWRIVPAAALEREPAVPVHARPGDQLKVTFQVAVADAENQPMLIVAGWWVRIQDVSRPGLWGTTLASTPKLSATLRTNDCV